MNVGLADKYNRYDVLPRQHMKKVGSQKVVTQQRTTDTTFFHAIVAEKRHKTGRS